MALILTHFTFEFNWIFIPFPNKCVKIPDYPIVLFHVLISSLLLWSKIENLKTVGTSKSIAKCTKCITCIFLASMGDYITL